MSKIDRIARWLSEPKLLDRYFNEEELLAVYSRGTSAAQSLAARFAAKEAFVKALGTGFRNIALKDIIVRSEASGKPVLTLDGAAKKTFLKIGGRKAFVSLTHEVDNALAMVVIEGKAKRAAAIGKQGRRYGAG